MYGTGLKYIPVKIKITASFAFVRKVDTSVFDILMLIPHENDHAQHMYPPASQLDHTTTTMMVTYEHVLMKIALNMKVVFSENVM
ncbi:hypothetical protein STEG23_027019 [Scotinomys teguina]